nr:hypothetical protein [Tanacetum cinerariifolium]
EPAVATDSSGVPSAIEKSPLDFADEAEASGRETAAPEMPPPEGVLVAIVPESGQAVEAVSLAAMQLSLNSNVFISEGIPDDVSDPDPLAFAGAPSHSPVDVPQSSQGVTVAEEPGSGNASSPIEYNVNLARQVAMGSQLRLRFEQEAKLLKKSVAQVALREKRIQDRELEIKNLEVRLETKAEMKRA